MADLFRKTSLEKLSSPEQLDRAIVITPPSFWIALAGGFVIVLGALLWAVFGRIPVNVESQGIYLNGEGVRSVYGEVDGIVAEVRVKEGDQIKEGDVVAVVGGGEITGQIEKLGQRIESVERVTLKSRGDVATADNRSLLDLKDEQIGLEDAYTQATEALSKKRAELSAEQAKERELKARLDGQKNSYYYALGNTGNSSAELIYSRRQSELANFQSEYSVAKQTADQAASEESQLRAQYDSQKKAVEALEKEIRDGSSSVSGSSIDDDDALAAKKEELSAANLELDALRRQLDSVSGRKEDAKKELDEAKNKLSAAESAFDAANNDYAAELSRQSQSSVAQEIAGNEYTQLVSDYAEQKSRVEVLKQSIDSLEQEADSAETALNTQTERIQSSFDTTKASLLDELNRELEQQMETLKKYEIVSTQEGVVQEVVSVTGAAVTAGSEIVKVKKDSGNQKEALCYMALGNGKKVVPGMKVMIYPTTVNKQEYGHMTGTVESVAGYVTSADEMKKRLGDDTLVQFFSSQGPVVEVVCSLEEDPDTASGYAWSSKKGRDVWLADGTVLEASIVVEKKAPITMVIPLIKSMFTESVSSGEAASNET